MDQNAIPEFRKAVDELFYKSSHVQGGGGVQGNSDLRNIEVME